MRIKDCTALVTGANGGLGRDLAAELIARGARRVYAAGPANDESLGQVVALAPARILPLTLDVTDEQQARTASQAATDVTLLINNAGVTASGPSPDADPGCIERDLAVNFLGIIRVSRAFAPVLEANGGMIVNVLTMIGLRPAAGTSAYGTPEAAARSVTQALRALLTPRGVGVVGVYPGAMGTATPADAGSPATDTVGVARRALDGVEAGSPEITPGDFSAQTYAAWLNDPCALARQSAGWPRAATVARQAAGPGAVIALPRDAPAPSGARHRRPIPSRHRT